MDGSRYKKSNPKLRFIPLHRRSPSQDAAKVNVRYSEKCLQFLKGFLPSICYGPNCYFSVHLLWQLGLIVIRAQDIWKEPCLWLQDEVRAQESEIIDSTIPGCKQGMQLLNAPVCKTTAATSCRWNIRTKGRKKGNFSLDVLMFCLLRVFPQKMVPPIEVRNVFYHLSALLCVAILYACC